MVEMDFSINEMMKMQKSLQEKYKDKWESISPETGKNKLLWMIGEIGEVIDVIKKNGSENACDHNGHRKELVEEMNGSITIDKTYKKGFKLDLRLKNE